MRFAVHINSTANLNDNTSKKSINKSRCLNSRHSPSIRAIRHSSAQIRATEPAINFKLEFTISQVDAHSMVMIIAKRERERERERERKKDRRDGDRIREKLSGFRSDRSRVAYCCDIMHHYGSLLAARDGPSPLEGREKEGNALVLRARLADFHG